MNFPGYSTRIWELNWYGGGDVYSRDIQSNVLRALYNCLSLRWSSLSCRSPPSSPPTPFIALRLVLVDDGRGGSIEWRLISQMFTIIVPRGLYRLTKDNRKKRNKKMGKNKKQPTFQFIWFSLLTYVWPSCWSSVKTKCQKPSSSSAGCKRRRRKKAAAAHSVTRLYWMLLGFFYPPDHYRLDVNATIG